MENKKLSRVEILEQIKKHEEEIKVASRLISYIRIEKERLEEQVVSLKQQSEQLNKSLVAYQKQLDELPVEKAKPTAQENKA